MEDVADPDGSLLLVCRANLIRSPLAAALLRRRLDEVGRDDLTVVSGGLRTLPDEEPGAEAVRVARGLGVDLEARRPTEVTGARLGRAGLVVTMTEQQRSTVCRSRVGMVARTFTLVELVRLLDSGARTSFEDWAAVAQWAHGARPLVPPADRTEDVHDPIGMSADHLRSVAATLSSLTWTLASRMVGEPHADRLPQVR